MTAKSDSDDDTPDHTYKPMKQCPFCPMTTRNLPQHIREHHGGGVLDE